MIRSLCDQVYVEPQLCVLCRCKRWLLHFLSIYSIYNCIDAFEKLCRRVISGPNFFYSAMARRRKTRTHNKGGTAAKTSNGIPGDPKSFVIKHGQVGYSITQLVRDMRKVMEPNTATRLRVSGFLSYMYFLIPEYSLIMFLKLIWKPTSIGTDPKQAQRLSRIRSHPGSYTSPGLLVDWKVPYSSNCATTCRPESKLPRRTLFAYEGCTQF